MDPTMIRHLALARLADVHRQAERDSLARAVRQTHRAQGQHYGNHRSGLVAVITRRGRPRPAPGSC